MRTNVLFHILNVQHPLRVGGILLMAHRSRGAAVFSASTRCLAYRLMGSMKTQTPRVIHIDRLDNLHAAARRYCLDNRMFESNWIVILIAPQLVSATDQVARLRCLPLTRFAIIQSIATGLCKASPALAEAIALQINGSMP